MDTAADALVKDAFGNVTGGVRLPALEVPLAVYESGNVADPSLPPFLQFIGNLACALSGSVFPFDQGTVDSLYPDHDVYVGQVARSVNALKQQGLLLQLDAVSTKVSAAQSDIGE